MVVCGEVLLPTNRLFSRFLGAVAVKLRHDAHLCRLRATCSECQASGRLKGRKGASQKLLRLIIITLCVISAILPTIECAKLENPQIRLLINDDDLLQEKSNLHETAGSRSAAGDATQHDHSGLVIDARIPVGYYQNVHPALRNIIN
ncbi:hypothetical protein EVAR_68925_1 [Eumeta japonica]|uniref:Uncharacterized protein n=1 Tax=Eumeta variegata TaxID=151549 RepID=A0A4C1SX73_EUMVA|nr:hypothetical protein EVAR_68925_1 [Eumeta japonica]